MDGSFLFFSLKKMKEPNKILNTHPATRPWVILMIQTPLSLSMEH
jgi:hypothetical protein